MDPFLDLFDYFIESLFVLIRMDDKNDKAEGPNRPSKENVITIAVIVAAIAGIMAFIFYGASIKFKLDADVFRLTYQFLLLVVLGGAVSLIFNIG